MLYELNAIDKLINFHIFNENEVDSIFIETNMIFS